MANLVISGNILSEGSCAGREINSNAATLGNRLRPAARTMKSLAAKMVLRSDLSFKSYLKLK